MKNTKIIDCVWMHYIDKERNTSRLATLVDFGMSLMPKTFLTTDKAKLHSGH